MELTDTELATGRTVATLQFHSGVEEIFAVELLPGVRNPKLCGPTLAEEHDREIWIVPGKPDAPPSPPPKLEASARAPDASSPTLGVPIAGISIAAGQLVQDGVAAHQQGRLSEALQFLRRAAELEPDSAAVLNHLGNLHQDLGDQAAAVSCYQRAVALQPGFSAVHQNLGVLYASWGEPHEALRHFELAQQAQPQAMNLVLGATVLPIIYDSSDDVRTWRGRLVDRVRALVEAGVVTVTMPWC